MDLFLYRDLISSSFEKSVSDTIREIKNGIIHKTSTLNITDYILSESIGKIVRNSIIGINNFISTDYNSLMSFIVSNENTDFDVNTLVEDLTNYIDANCYSLSYSLQKLDEKYILDEISIKNLFYKSHVKDMILNEETNNKLVNSILLENKSYLEDVITEYNSLNKTEVSNIVFNEAFEPTQSTVKKILDALVKNRMFNEDMIEYLFVVLADWLRFNTLENADDRESRKKWGKYFMSLKDFKDSVIAGFESKKKYIIELARTDKTALMKYLEVKKRYFNDYKHEAKDIERPFYEIKRQIVNLHNMQSEKFKVASSLLYNKKDTTKYIDDESEVVSPDSKTIIGGEARKSNRQLNIGDYKTNIPSGKETYVPLSHSSGNETKFEKDNVGGLSVAHIKREETTEELEIRDLINTIKLMATTLQKIKGGIKFETSKQTNNIVSVFVTSLESILCFYMQRMYVGLNAEEKNGIGWVLYATKYLIDYNKLLTPIYFDFFQLYGQSLNKLNLDFLDYDEVMQWEDKFFKDKMKADDYKRLPTEDVKYNARTTILQGVATSINSLHKKMVKAEMEKSQYKGGDEKKSTQLLQNLIQATKDKLSFITQTDDITEKMLRQSKSQLEKLQHYNNKKMEEYMSTLSKKTLHDTKNIPSDADEDWIFSHLPSQYLAYKVSKRAYEEGLDIIELRILEINAGRNYIKPSQISDIGKLKGKDFKELFGSDPMFDDEESNLDDESFDVNLDDIDKKDE